MKGVKECFPKAFLYSSETARIYCGNDVYYSPASFIKAISSNSGYGYSGDMVDVGGIMLTPKAYEEAVSFNDSLNATVEDYIRNFDIDETEIQQLKLSRIFRKSSCDYGYGTMSGSSNGALLYGVAVCEGMAECMKVLCELADIECVVIREVPLDHAWVSVNAPDLQKLNSVFLHGFDLPSKVGSGFVCESYKSKSHGNISKLFY